jgi:hypothetical protein
MYEPPALNFDDDFLRFYGAFHASWATLELVTACAVSKLLKISFEEGNILTSGMEFGRKATLLKNLVYRSDNPQRKMIIRLINKILNEAKRNVFAHGFLTSTKTTVSFIDRSRGGDYTACKHTFALPEFVHHVRAYMETAHALEEALEITPTELHRFANAALSENTKSTKSPVPPNSRA